MFKEKYLKYKQKYLELKGGGGNQYYDGVIKMYIQFMNNWIIPIDNDDGDDGDHEPPEYKTILIILTKLNEHYSNQIIKDYVDKNKQNIQFAITYALSDAIQQTKTDTNNKIRALTNLQLI